MRTQESTTIRGFFAYPSRPPEIGVAIREALRNLHRAKRYRDLSSWEENDIPGRFVIDPILTKIDDSDVLIADISALNFNLMYEIGYAIGRSKRVMLLRNRAISTSTRDLTEVGLLDTLGYANYSSAADIEVLVRGLDDVTPLVLVDKINATAPIFLLSPRAKADNEIRMISRIKKARLPFRSFDPEEHGRLSSREAIENVSQSHGVAVTLLSKHRTDASVHNARAAFGAGLALALGKEILLLQHGEDPVPLDYRDLVQQVQQPKQIDEFVHVFAAAVSARLTSATTRVVSSPENLLERVNLGSSSAENELGALGNYYLETDEFQRSLRGEVQVVSGRKGSGKTALFIQLRNRLRADRTRVILDLRPEGYQLLKFKEKILDLMVAGTREHTITAFWEYLLLLEVCHKLLQKDRQVHMRNHDLFDAYRRLSSSYEQDAFVSEGDFAERMLQLTQRIADDFELFRRSKSEEINLSRAEITELLYKHDVADLRAQVVEYLQLKDSLWILVDNLDKGWPPHGVTGDDLLTLRCLLDALGKLERSLARKDVPCRGIVFIRNDVYELLIDRTSDRGKTARVSLDWTDPEMLRELLRLRLVHSEVVGNPPFDDIWGSLVVSHIRGEESSQYLIERCLMRPRALIELLQACRSHAVNLRHERIEQSDIKAGEATFSADLVTNISFEIRDVLPGAADLLYEFIESPDLISLPDLEENLDRFLGSELADKGFEMLLWYGFLGLVRSKERVTYIYDVNYDLRRLMAILRKRSASEVVLKVNPAFWRGLEIANAEDLPEHA